MCLVCAMLTLVGEGMGVIDDVRTAAPMIVSVMAGEAAISGPGRYYYRWVLVELFHG